MRPAAPLVRVAVAAWLAVVATSGPVRIHAEPPPPAARPALTGTLRLSVLDVATGESIPWANLVSLDGREGYLADGNGTFRLSLPPGPARYRVVHVAYLASLPFEVDIRSGATIERNIYLTAQAHQVEPVRITARRAESPAVEVQGMRSLSVRNTAALPNPTDDIFRTVRMLPGVAAGDVGSRFHLRGGGVDQMLVRVDGMELRELFHGRDFGGITSVIPRGAIERIDVYPAGFPARLGGRLSGAVDLDLRSQGRSGVHGTLGADATSVRVLTEWNTEHAAYLVSARQSHLDHVLDAIQDEAVIQPSYRDLLLHVVHRPDDSRSISLNYLRSEDHALYEDRVATHFVNADYLDDYVWSTFRFLPSKRFTLDGTLHRAWNQHRREFGIGGWSNQSRERVGARLQMTVAAHRDHLLAFGGQTEREWGWYEYVEEGPLATASPTARTTEQEYAVPENRFRRHLAAAFVQDEWRATPRLTLHLGARFSWDDGTGHGYLGPRASAAYTVSNRTTLRTYWGGYDQAPRLVPDEATATGETFLTDRLQIAEHRGVGLERRMGRYEFGLDAYHKIFHRLDGLVTRLEDGEEETHLITHGRSRGVEMSLRRTGSWSNWWAAYTLGHSEWSDGRRTFTRDFDQLHALTFANTLHLSNAWDLGFSYAFHTGTPYTEQSWQRAGASDWTLSEGAPNGERLPDYHRLDVRLRRHFRMDGWDLSVYAEALNVTNHPNVLWYGWRIYGDDGPLPEAERVTRTGIPGVPSVGMEIRF